VEPFEVGKNRENLALYEQLAAEHRTAALTVPAFFFANAYWIGFHKEVAEEITEAVRDAAAMEWRNSAAGSKIILPRKSFDLPIFGPIDLITLPAFAVTGAIALVDGFNPCSLWVLTFLIGLIIRTGSRGRTIAVGLTFLSVTALVYGLFILGLFRILSAGSGIAAVRFGVAALAVAMGMINIKDFFAFKFRFSLTIPERYRSVIAQKGRSIFERSGSPIALVAATALFAFGICLIELPCTAGFPIVWSQYVATLNATAAVFWALFFLYLLVYLADEIILVAISTVLLRRLNFGKDQARVLKLLGGLVMAAVGLTYFFAPETTRTLTGVGLIFGSSIAATAAVIFVHHLFTVETHYRVKNP
jgi:hypothetical protein